MNGSNLRRWLRLIRLAGQGLRRLLLVLRGLDLRDQASVIVAFAHVAFVESYLVAAGEGALRDLADRCRSRSPRRRRPPAGELQVQLDQAAWSVEVAANCFPQSRCLSEAFALYLLLSAYGLPLSVVVGVSRGERRWLSAHAWVELETDLGAEIVHQPATLRSCYMPIIRIKAVEAT